MSASNDQENMDFKIVKKVDQLPLPVQIDLQNYPMADSGESYQVGCVSGPEPLPLSRLIFGACSGAGDGAECYVHFESGGFAHLYSVRHYKLSGNKAELVESSYVPEKCETVEQLKQILAAVAE